MKNDALKQLVFGILLCGILFWAVFVWFFGSKLYFSAGLWIGIAIAVFMAWHIYYSLDRGLDLPQEDASKYMYRMYAIRMAVVLAAFFLTAWLRLGNMAGVLFGMFSLKLGAYLQPLLQKLKEKKVNK